MAFVNPFQAEKPYLGFKRLQIGDYEIFEFRFVKNRYALTQPDAPPRTVLVELADQVLFLPDYLSHRLKDNDAIIDRLNSDDVKRFLCFGGKNSKG